MRLDSEEGVIVDEARLLRVAGVGVAGAAGEAGEAGIMLSLSWLF